MTVSIRAQVTIGAKSGFCFPSLATSQEEREISGWRDAVYGGVFMRFKLGGLLYLQPELNYSPQGGEQNGMQIVPENYISEIKLPVATTVYARFNSTEVLNYVDLPVLVQLRVADHELSYAAFAGPYVSFLVFAKTKLRGSSRLFVDQNGEIPFTPGGRTLPVLSFDRDIDTRPGIRKVIGGIQGGFSAGYSLWSGRLFFDVRAILGLTNVYNDPAMNGKARTQAWMMAVGYEFDLK